MTAERRKRIGPPDAATAERQSAARVPGSVFEDDLTGITLKEYCRRTGETEQAVKNRVRSGRWLRGVHVVKPVGSKYLWVMLDAHEAWLMGRRAPGERSVCRPF